VVSRDATRVAEHGRRRERCGARSGRRDEVEGVGGQLEPTRLWFEHAGMIGDGNSLKKDFPQKG
jgi:hypothetical protein